MSDCKLTSTQMSGYGLAARVVLEEKGVAYDRIVIDPVDLKSAAYLAEVHPFDKAPAFYHGNFHLYETAAIARYVDEAFEGAALQPENAQSRAQMQKWINFTGQYIYPAVIVNFVMQRLPPKMRVFGGVTDGAIVSAAIPNIAHKLDLIEQALAGEGYYLAGDFSLAEVMVATMVHYIGMTRERDEFFGNRPADSG